MAHYIYSLPRLIPSFNATNSAPVLVGTDGGAYYAGGDSTPALTLVHSELIGNITGAAWVDLRLSQPQSAGRYRVELWPAEGLQSPEDSIFTSAAWLSTTRNTTGIDEQGPKQHGGSLTFALGTVPGTGQSSSDVVEVPTTLGARLAAAMRWQLRYATTSTAVASNNTLDTQHASDRVGNGSDGQVGIMVIREANWRGVGAADVGASSAMWDLIRSGYKDTWLNVRFIKSIDAMLELQESGLVEDATVTHEDLVTAKASFVKTFTRRSNSDRHRASAAAETGAYLSWIGCDRVKNDAGMMVSGCEDKENDITASHGSIPASSEDNEDDGLVPVAIGFVPALAAAAALNLPSPGVVAEPGRKRSSDGAAMEESLRLFDAVREAARDVPGRFRTNTLPIERVNVSLWRASSSWHQRDSQGFARRTPDSGGDWQIFAPGDGEDGYGQFGLTEENGGVVLSTTALVFEAGVYPQMYSDFADLVGAVTAMSEQLALMDAGVVEGPLLVHGNRSYLRLPIAAGSVPQLQCQKARKLPNEQRYPPDRWSERWCSYYKSVSWNLPGAGAFVYSFAKGLLQLDIPIVDDSVVDPSVTVWGTTVLGGGVQQRVALPLWAISRWPVELAQGFTIDVVGLNVGGQAYNLECDTWCNSFVGLRGGGSGGGGGGGSGISVGDGGGGSSSSHAMDNELCCTLSAA